MKKTKRFIEQLIFLIGLLVLWQLLYYLFVDVFSILKSYSVPSPKGVWESLLALIQANKLLPAVINRNRKLPVERRLNLR